MENSQKDFVTYNQAFRLKAIGFDEPCLFLYNSSDDEPKAFLANPPEPMDWNSLYVKNTNKHLMSAPTFSQVFRWFREKYNMQSAIKFTYPKLDRSIEYSFDIHFERLANGENPPVMVSHLVDSWLGLNLDLFETYEKAELTCLDKLLEIVEAKSE